MKQIIFLITFLLLMGCETSTDSEQQVPVQQSGEFYQLRVYTFSSESQVNVTDEYLRRYYLPELKKLGIGQVGVFKKLQDEIDSTFRTFVLLPFNDLKQLIEIDRISDADPDEMADQEYHVAPHDNPPYVRFETIVMSAFEGMSQLTVPPFTNDRQKRIYELRSYESSNERYYRNKVDMFNAGGEIVLFDKLGFNAVFYGEVLAGSRMPNLMYMTTFENMESRDAHWKAFFESDEWEVLSALEKYKNNVSRGEVILLHPTEYSDY